MLRFLPTNTPSADPQLATVRAHFGQHGTALCNAATLIAGDTGAARVLRLISDLRSATRLERTHRKSLVDLHRLLSLDIAHDNQDAEIPCWMSLDPANPKVEQICLLTDRVFDLLCEIGDGDEAVAMAALSIPTRTAA